MSINSNDEQVGEEKRKLGLAEFVKFADEYRNLDKSIELLYPIALVSEHDINVYDIDYKNKYQYKVSFDKPECYPENILAAMPMGEYNGKMVAVVYEDVLYSVEGWIFILHEFVHCYQYYNGEQWLKEKLQVAREAWERQDYMWELTYPFPYEAPNVKECPAIVKL